MQKYTYKKALEEANLLVNFDKKMTISDHLHRINEGILFKEVNNRKTSIHLINRIPKPHKHRDLIYTGAYYPSLPILGLNRKNENETLFSLPFREDEALVKLLQISYVFENNQYFMQWNAVPKNLLNDKDEIVKDHLLALYNKYSQRAVGRTPYGFSYARTKNFQGKSAYKLAIENSIITKAHHEVCKLINVSSKFRHLKKK